MKLEHEIKQNTFDSEFQKLMLNIIFTGSWLNGHSTRRFKPFGISPQQYNILRILRGQHPNPATVNLLKDRMLDKMSNASRLVEKLRNKGLVERTTCPNDRRAVDVLITQKGLDLLKQIDEQQKDWHEIYETLTESEARAMNQLLDKFRG